MNTHGLDLKNIPTGVETFSYNKPLTGAEREQKKIECEKKWKEERERKSKMVVGKFLFNECPGGELKFSFREFKGEEIKNYTLRHDQVYQLPLGVALHLNDRCSYYEFEHNLDGGKMIDARNMYIKSKVHRTNFIPLDWQIDVGNTGRSVDEVSFTNPLNNIFEIDGIGK
jgi:hypothetical protein